MSGVHLELSEAASQHVAPELKRNCRDFLRMTLENQVVRLNDPEHAATFIVCIRSGMGMTCSGEVSDSCIIENAEKHLVSDKAHLERYNKSVLSL